MDLSTAGADLLGHTDAALLLALSRLTRGVSGREVARLSGVKSQSTAQRALTRLATVGIVTTEEHAHATLYSLNRSHVLWPGVREILTASATINELIRMIAQDAGGDITVAIFGSFARGEAGADSDIDIAVVAPDHMTPDLRERIVDELRDCIGAATGNPTQVLLVTMSELHGMVVRNDPLIESWIAEATTIHGVDMGSLIAKAGK